jgi:Zn finger protein HypA/HybF involved in hydrogenase expression
MIATEKCQHCSGEFEFEVGNKTEFCPHCGKETLVQKTKFIPPPQFAAKNTEQDFFPALVACGYCKEKIARAAVLCPRCGGFKSIPFRLVWQATCGVLFVVAILGLIGALIDAIFHAASGN